MTSNSFDIWREQQLEEIEKFLTKRLANPRNRLNKLSEAMSYAVLDGGKRIRPLLVMAAGGVFDASKNGLVYVASAVELIHCYSLVHDDMPCMDDDDLRRGRKTVHKKYNDATALLVGDALQSLAFGLLVNEYNGLSDHVKLKLVCELSNASGINGMAGGQFLDLEFVGRNANRAELEEMHSMKTGALLAACVRMGAATGSVTQEQYAEPLRRYSSALGLGFQVVDDILDVTATTDTLGKTAGKDARNSKPTFVTVLGMEVSQEIADDLERQAKAAAKELPQAGGYLVDLVDVVFNRDF
jgi:farnesyl diphosphate synthase